MFLHIEHLYLLFLDMKIPDIYEVRVNLTHFKGEEIQHTKRMSS